MARTETPTIIPPSCNSERLVHRMGGPRRRGSRNPDLDITVAENTENYAALLALRAEIVREEYARLDALCAGQI